jgi:hypothetical protein
LRSLTTYLPQLAEQLPADVHDTRAWPRLPFAPNWCGCPHRPLTSLTTNAGCPPPAAQVPGPVHDNEPIWTTADGTLVSLKTVTSRCHSPLFSLVTKA